MRLLCIASLSTLALLCAPVSASHGIDLENSHSAMSACPQPDSAAPTTIGEQNSRASAQEGVSLDPGKPIERELTGGQSQIYKIALNAGLELAQRLGVGDAPVAGHTRLVVGQPVDDRRLDGALDFTFCHGQDCVKLIA